MKILDVSGFYAEGGGGVRAYVRHKLDYAARHGHEVVVVAPGAADRTDRLPGGRIVWVESPPMPFDPVYRRFARPQPVWRVIAAEAPDVIEGSSPWRGGAIAARAPGPAPRAFVFHQDVVAGYPYTFLGPPLSLAAVDALCWPWWAHLRRLAARFDVTVAAGEGLARRLREHGLRNAGAVPFGVEPRRFSPAHRDEALRRELLALCGLAEDAVLVIVVGRFHPEKRHRTIIDGIARARAHAGRPIGLVLIGDGLARAAVERRARRAGGVHLLGAVTDRDRLARLYASADVLAHGSAAETYGLVVAEALASGLPVVAPAVGGAGDLARLGPSRLYPPGDAAGLAGALLDLLASAPPRRAAAIPTADDHFKALFDLYAGLAASPRAAISAASAA